VPPPQPPINPFDTMKSSGVQMVGEAGPLPPMCPTCKRPLDGTYVAGSPVQQARADDGYPIRPTGAVVPGPVSPSQWTRGPARPVSQSPIMVNSRRVMTEQESQSLQNTVYLMTVLQSSGVPAQREWAAMKLQGVDPTIQPYVVEALVTAAKSDNAPLVRAASIQSLGHMGAATPPVMALLEGAVQDRDPRVRDEAVQAMHVLSGKPASDIQTAGYETGKR
jgi:hypothetical protein